MGGNRQNGIIKNWNENQGYAFRTINGEKARTSLSEIGGKEFKDRRRVFDLWIPFCSLKKLLESGIPSVFLQARQ